MPALKRKHELLSEIESRGVESIRPVVVQSMDSCGRCRVNCPTLAYGVELSETKCVVPSLEIS